MAFLHVTRECPFVIVLFVLSLAVDAGVFLYNPHCEIGYAELPLYTVIALGGLAALFMLLGLKLAIIPLHMTSVFLDIVPPEAGAVCNSWGAVDVVGFAPGFAAPGFAVPGLVVVTGLIVEGLVVDGLVVDGLENLTPPCCFFLVLLVGGIPLGHLLAILLEHLIFMLTAS